MVMWCLACIVGDIEDHWYFVMEAWVHWAYRVLPKVACSYPMVNITPEDGGALVIALFKLMAKLSSRGYSCTTPTFLPD